MRHSAKLAIAALTLVAGTAGLIIAGPLNPPAGSVQSTYKTLVEVEPRIAINAVNTPGDADSVFRISQPGSYYLTENIFGAAGMLCIEVAADDVTIDLNGMTIRGHTASFGGIIGDGARSNITVRNGTIRSIGNGVGLGYTAAGSRGWEVENVSVLNNGNDGMRLPGASIVRSSRAAFNAGYGIRSLDSSQVFDCISEQNSVAGVFVLNSSIVSRTIARSNSNNGIDASGDGTRVLDCTSTNNSGHGIVGLNGSVITSCVVRSNSLNGITANSSSLIENNSVTFNGGHGISFLGNCTVRENVSNSNGQSTLGAGIFTSGFRSRIEGNVCNDNDYGIRVTAGTNFITRNTVSSNTTLNWDVVVGNRCLVVQATNAGAISGNSGGTSPGSSDPNANFTY
ncbi:MAG: right-handed parallel beta-helix repeat-containing protein [Phycisphaeraceae bacterium]|nr:right-handed parallel beta-helix repeat-containing protein [Phycisphaeraceae bacterium]MCW5763425.1 right-handed parallel beta-helix repeat-containing protein [Phycisphaeraceae bacterium]